MTVPTRSYKSPFTIIANLHSTLKGLEFLIFTVLAKSRGSWVGTALGYGLDDRGSKVWFPAGAGNFSLHHRVQNGSGAHPGSYPMGTRGSFPGGKAAGAWSWPLTPSSAEVKNAWSYTSTPQYVSMAWCLVKHRDNSTYLPTLLYCCSQLIVTSLIILLNQSTENKLPYDLKSQITTNYEGILQNWTGGSAPLLWREKRWLLCQVVVVGVT
jgi:hypothetical protein